MVFLITSSLLGSANIITTIVQLRAPGMTWMRLPFSPGAVRRRVPAAAGVSAAGSCRCFATDGQGHGFKFVSADGAGVGGTVAGVAGGGSPVLWQHLFWFCASRGLRSDFTGDGHRGGVIANNTRKPIWGYKSLVYSSLALGFISFIVWAHHMYLTGMGTTIAAFFQTTTMMISIPSVIILTCLLISLWGGRIRFNTPMLFALAFLPMFGIGGLTGLPLGFSASDLHLHDTYYVIGHFHYVVAPGTIFGIFAGFIFAPKVTGRFMNEFWGKVHFWGSLIFMNVVFMPMFAQGLSGMLRRMSDGGINYSLAQVGVEGGFATSWR